MGGRIIPVIVVGYAPHASIVDPEILADYQDYPVGMRMELEEARACLDRGVLPPGLVLYSPRGRVGVVKGVYGNEVVEVVE